MNQDLKDNAKQLHTNYSTWVVAILMGIVAYWMQLPLDEQARLVAAYPWLKHAAPLVGLLSFLLARIAPQSGSAPPAEPPEQKE